MSSTIRPISEINKQAKDILIREIGVVDTLRFLSQFTSGSGDYTKERGKWLDDLSVERIVSEIKERRQEDS